MLAGVEPVLQECRAGGLSANHMNNVFLDLQPAKDERTNAHELYAKSDQLRRKH